MPRRVLSSSLGMGVKLGGEVVVTGLGGAEEDEFFFGLLSEQGIWDRVILGRPENPVSTRKRFLTRTARYSGTLNVLEFADTSSANTSLETLLSTANTWLAFNLTASEVPAMQELAIKSNAERIVFTMSLPAADINNTAVVELDAARQAITAAGKNFTGVRHGAIVSGSEDNAYDIVNATMPCTGPVVERGVLARVVAELVSISEAGDSVCGVSSSGAFAAAYLNVLRSSGLNRNQEVKKIFTGGLERVARLTVAEYKNRNEKALAAKERKEKRAAKKEEEERLQKEKKARVLAEQNSPGTTIVTTDSDASIMPSWDEEMEEEGPTYQERIKTRTEEILQNVWKEYNVRMYTKSTSKSEFFDNNRRKAITLALSEFADEKAARKSTVESKQAQQRMLTLLADVNRKQYSKLLALERKEMANQKVISDTWVKYIYLLIESTLRACESDGVLFNNMDEFAQTMTLRRQANLLRAECGLDEYDVVYDPLDATVIVDKLSSSALSLVWELQ